jgi:hypothetical protein
MLRERWGLDHVGNWAGSVGGSAPWAQGRVCEGNLDGGLGFERGAYAFGAGMFEAFSRGGATAGDEYRVSDHVTDVRNQLEVVKVKSGDGALHDTSSRDVLHAHDPAGNLIFDGTYVYQYDAWNRLVQVNKALVPNQQPQSWDDLGPLVKHFTYDGLGRLIRTVSPYPSPEMQADGADIRAEHYFYDGARRVQDVQYDPVSSMAMMMVQGDFEEQLLAGEEMEVQADPVEGAPVDASGIGISLAASLSGDSSGNFGSEPEDPIGTPIPTFLPRRVEREYIWGPGDGRGGVDELLAQCDADRKLWPVLTDAGGDVVAIVGRSGPGPNAVALVAGQWTYDAYGAVISADHLLPHPMNKVGHKGLFAERLDVGVADATVQGSMVSGGVGVETPKLTAFGHHIYHNRNRVHNPGLGRFMQSDPNASGVAVSGMGMMGRIGEPSAPRFDLADHLNDGLNTFQYIHSSPFSGSDPLGLFVGAAVDAYGTVASAAGALAYALVSIYSDNLSHDVEWALDWQSPDEWHTRSDASWIQDVYDDIGIDDAVDDATMVGWPSDDHAMAIIRPGGGSPTRWYKVARALNKQGKVAHHIISWYKDSRKKFDALKQQYPGIRSGLWDIKNMAGLDPKDHGKGRHRKVYHERVWKFIHRCMDPTDMRKPGLSDDQAFRQALKSLREQIVADPKAWFGGP